MWSKTGGGVDVPNRIRAHLRIERDPHAIAALDGVRAVAILLVLGRHAVRPFLDPQGELFEVLGWDVATPFLNGWLGVDLFFVLSGFLIAGSLMRLQNRGGFPRLNVYVLKRVLRIVPTYYFVLLITAAGFIPFYEVPSERLADRVAYHLLFLQDYLFSDIVVAFWSLGVEEKFYLIAPIMWLVLSALRRPRRQYVALAGLILLGPLFRFIAYLGGTPADTYDVFFFTFRSPFHMSLDPLFVGVLAALIYQNRERIAWTRDKRLLGRLFWLGGLIVGVLFISHEMLGGQISLFDKTLQPLILSFGMGAAVLALALGGGPTRWFQGQGLFIVSKLAFTLYLVHLLVIPGVIHMLNTTIGLAGLSPSAQFALFLGPYLAVAGLAALLVFYIVEKPFLRLKDRVGKGTRRASQSTRT